MEINGESSKRIAEEANIDEIETLVGDSKEKKMSEAMKCASEKDVGIVSYVSTISGIRGILKDSCDDFIVQEIDTNGIVVDLHSEDIPEDLSTKEKTISQEEGIMRLKEIYNEEIVLSILKFIEIVKADDSTKEGCTLTPIDDKDKRKKVHETVREAFPMLVSDTDGQSIVLYSCKNNTKYHAVHREKWAGGDNDYVEFTLKKMGQDTMSVLSTLSDRVRRNPKTFSYYGTKDKRAITYQKVIANRVSPRELRGAAQHMRNVWMGDYRFVHDAAIIGKSGGNRFTITLRNVMNSNPGDTVETLRNRLTEILSSLTNTGYLNYYGLQRFGNNASNIAVGVHLLRGEWKEAFYGILESSSSGGDAVKKALAVLEETDDCEAAARTLPKFMRSEALMLRGLGKSGGKGYTNALAKMPYNRRTMYIHAVQSLLFNRFASFRFSLGLQLLPGDLISDIPDLNELTDTSHLVTITADNRDKYSIHQLVLPMPGMSTPVPDVLQKEYTKVMQELALTNDCWGHAIRDYQMHGSYRRMLLRPKDMKGEILDDDSMRLAFSLDSGCYATMLIREVTKFETDAKSQLSLM